MLRRRHAERHADAGPRTDPSASVRATRRVQLRLRTGPVTRPSGADNARARSGTMDGMGARVSDRIAAIAESATLAVDAKAKALKAAGRPVIGFGAGEPDFPTPDYIVEAAVAAAPRPEEPPLHAGRRASRAARGDRRQDAARHRLRGRRRPGAGHQRRQAGGLQRLRHPARPGRRGAAHRAVLDDLPRGDQAGRRRPGRGRHRRDQPAISPRSSSSRRPAPTAPRCCCSSRRPTRPARSTRRRRSRRSGLGGRARPLGRHRRDLRAPGLRRRRASVSIAHTRRASRSSCSTGWPRPTR